MRRRQLTPSATSSSSDSDRLDIESYFDIDDKQEKTDANTKPTDVNTNIDGDDEANLLNLKQLACKDNVDTVPIDVNTDVNGDNEANLAQIAKEENAHLLKYYLNQENNSDESEDKDKDYSDSSLLFLDIIEGQFNRYISYSLFPCRFLLLIC